MASRLSTFRLQKEMAANHRKCLAVTNDFERSLVSHRRLSFAKQCPSGQTFGIIVFIMMFERSEMELGRGGGGGEFAG